MLPSLLFATLLVSAPEATTAVNRLPPVDQCATDPSFAAFRNELLAIIERRDRHALLAVVADDIEVDFGGGAGRDTFARTWNLDRPATSGLWDELTAALRLGCARDPEGTSFASPSMFLSGVIDDPYMTTLVIRPGAPLHAAADATSPVVATLDWDLVTIIEWDGQTPWQLVELADRRRGYVRSADVRSPIDYRAVFQQLGGRWRMTAFIAGD